MVPLALFGLSLILLAVRAPLRAFRVLMVLFIISGGIGTVLHYRGKQEFALERNPSLRGIALVREATFKGTNPPLLAAGAMVALGWLGLLLAFRDQNLAGQSLRQGDKL